MPEVLNKSSERRVHRGPALSLSLLLLFQATALLSNINPYEDCSPPKESITTRKFTKPEEAAKFVAEGAIIRWQRERANLNCPRQEERLEQVLV